ncbi:MAG: thiamine-phosphate kinase [Salinivirgaceae bacterium]|jgi:thiamine-monophosphate kinase|nr:thiamine-phosphate kinase [Salinivirgaceae bacterium]
MTERKKLTPLSEVGEFGLIDHISKHVKLKNNETIKGIGDDAAVMSYGENQMVVTTDMLIEGVHFDLMYTPLKHLGYKAVVVNLSDVFAMNAVPKQITVSLAMSGKFTLEAIDELYSGIYAACEAYNVDLVGGDTTSSVTGMAISVTAIGAVEPGKAVYRNGAKANDLICVSGDLGAAYIGLQLLEREKEVFKSNPNVQPELEGNDYILQRILKPEARGDVVELLGSKGVIPTSMMDISDGLSSELLHICKQSECGCRIYEDKIPINDAIKPMSKEMNIEPLVAALNGGEDYELLFTISQADYDKIKDNQSVTVIGHITDKTSNAFLVPKSGEEIQLVAQGWTAYNPD